MSKAAEKVTITDENGNKVDTTTGEIKEASELFDRSLPMFEGAVVHFLEQKLKAASVNFVGAEHGEDLQMENKRTYLVTAVVKKIGGERNKDGLMVKTATLEVAKVAGVPEHKSAKMYSDLLDK